MDNSLDEKLVRLNPSKSSAHHSAQDISGINPQDALLDSSQGKINNQKRIITRIEAQKTKGRYNIYIDGEYAFPVDEGVLVKHILRKGSVVSPDFQRQLVAEDNVSKAYSRALHYLNYKMRTEKEVRDDLMKQGYAQQSDVVIEKLLSLNLLDDELYAKSYTRTMAQVNRKGPRVIERELVQKGVSPQAIEVGQAEYTFEEQVSNAYVLIKKRMKKTHKTSERQRMQKINAYLMQKGFDQSVIAEAFNQAEPGVTEDEEYQALVQQGDKALKRYKRKATGYALKQKVRAFLYSKGFSAEMIECYVDEKDEW